MEVNRLIRENVDSFMLDGVISVIDVENWRGYEDTSVTAKMQARYTDLIVFNKWEVVEERKFEDCLDRVGDLEIQTAWVKSRRGWVDQGVIMGIDGSLIGKEGVEDAMEGEINGEAGHGHQHEHQEEVEVLSVRLEVEEEGQEVVDVDAFEELLLSAPKDEVYRIKGLVRTGKPPPDSTGEERASGSAVKGKALYVLNWAFGRWTYTKLADGEADAMKGAAARLTFILARGESTKWKKKIEGGDLLELEGKAAGGRLRVEKIG